jgi:hypothetical protein
LRQLVVMVVCLILVKMTVEECLDCLCRMRVVRRRRSVVLEFVSRKANSDRRSEGPGSETDECSPAAARTKHTQQNGRQIHENQKAEQNQNRPRRLLDKGAARR